MVILGSLRLMGKVPSAGPHTEFCIEERPAALAMYSPALEAQEGMVAIPVGSGWGVTIRENWLARKDRQKSALRDRARPFTKDDGPIPSAQR